MNLISNYEIGFLGSPKHLYQMLSWGLRCKRPFWIRFCENTSLPERFMLFSIERLRFDCFWLLFMSSHRLVHHMLIELEDAKSSFSIWICGRTTCTENNFSCCAIDACMFSSVVYVHGHEIFCRVLRSKTVFSEANSGKSNLFRKKILSDIAQWTFNCFQTWYFGTPGPIIGTWVSLEKRRYPFEKIFGGTIFSEKKFCFQTFSPKLVLFSRVALR